MYNMYIYITKTVRIQNPDIPPDTSIRPKTLRSAFDRQSDQEKHSGDLCERSAENDSRRRLCDGTNLLNLPRMS